MRQLKIINDMANKIYIGLRFYGSYDIGYWKQATKSYKSVKRLLKYNPEFYGTEKDVQDV